MNQVELPLPFRYRAAKDPSKKAPALILLHGYGSNEDDLFSFSGELSEDYSIFSLRAPLAMQPFGYAWYSIYFDGGMDKFTDDEQALAARGLILECIDGIIEHYPVDPEKVCLIGFSQGCILSLAVALSNPEKIRAVVGLSGYVHPPIMDLQPKEAYAGLDVYSSHGTADQVIPVDWARKTPSFLDELGIRNSYSEFPVGHGVAPQNFFEFRAWLDTVLNQ